MIFFVSETPESEVRLATVTDAATLATLLYDFNTDFDSETDDPDTLERRFAVILGHEAVFAVLAEDAQEAERATGFGLLTLRPSIWFDGPVATLDELYVVPDQRGRGIGTRLITAARTELKTRGCPELHINVDEVDTDARRFYERHGFVNIESEADGRMLCYIGPT